MRDREDATDRDVRVSHASLSGRIAFGARSARKDHAGPQCRQRRRLRHPARRRLALLHSGRTLAPADRGARDHDAARQRDQRDADISQAACHRRLQRVRRPHRDRREQRFYARPVPPRFGVAPHRINAIPLGVSEFWFAERKSRADTREAIRHWRRPGRADHGRATDPPQGSQRDRGGARPG